MSCGKMSSFRNFFASKSSSKLGKEEVRIVKRTNPDGSITTTTTRIIKSPSGGTTRKTETSTEFVKSGSTQLGKNNGISITPPQPESTWFSGKPKPKAPLAPPNNNIQNGGSTQNGLDSTENNNAKRIFGTKNKFKEIVSDENSKGKVDESIQDFEKIRTKLFGTGKLFEDEDFPAKDESVFYSLSAKREITWRRPHELVENPDFFVGGASRFDVKQGELGNCWFLAAVANLTMVEPLFYQVVPKDNSFSDKYCGAFHFRFWQYGKWIDVVVDDRLPCSPQGRLLFMHSADKTEFWSALLEKAYAKLAGSYEALSGGQASEALQDFSGGLVVIIEIKNSRETLFATMEKAVARKSFMSCALASDPKQKEAKLSVGLVRGHAYSITDVKKVDVSTPSKTGKIPLIRIRNPWGNEFEWKGAWSDGSKEWTLVTESEKEKIGLSFGDDGEFWMSLHDYIEYFDTMEIVNLSPDSLLPGMPPIDGVKSNTKYFHGTWIPGCTAGGCINYIVKEPKTFPSNPQYIVEFETADQTGDTSKCTVLVALMQKNRRSKRKDGVGALSIGLAIYELDDTEEIPNPLDLDYFMYHRRLCDSGAYTNLREVSKRVELLPKKRYCIIPSTFSPNQDGEFLIRIFSESQMSMRENDGEIGMGKVDEKIGEKESESERSVAEDKLGQLFKEVAGEDEEIGWAKLKKVLDSYLNKQFGFIGFSREVCRSMVAMVDADRSGKLGLDEFTELWKNIVLWKSAFKIYDEDGSGSLDSFELRKALTAAGYSVNNRVLESLVLRYGDEDGNISFEDFIMCSVKLKAMIELFKEKDVKNKNEVSFTLAEWVEKTVYA